LRTLGVIAFASAGGGAITIWRINSMCTIIHRGRGARTIFCAVGAAILAAVATIVPARSAWSQGAVVMHSAHGGIDTFFLTDFETVFFFTFPTNPGDFVRLGPKGTNLLHLASNRAEIVVFDFLTGDVLATGEGMINVSVTFPDVNERAIVRAKGDVEDSATGEPLQLNVKAVIKDGDFKNFDFSLTPL
jgi:hypothetical protein